MGGVNEGSVEAIFISAERGDLPQPVASVIAVAGKGLVGNRYFDEGRPERGAHPDRGGGPGGARGRARHRLDGAASRRNVLTRGVRLNDLVGERFRVGELECRGIELCEPCLHLEAMTYPGVVKGLVHRAGLNAEILVGGELRPGDPVTPF